MQFESDADIERVAHGLIKQNLPRADWTHAAHFAAAAWLMTSNSHDAFKDMPDMIRSYNEASGNPNTDTQGYHETITVASLLATKHFLDCKTADQPLFELVNHILSTELGDSDWPLKYWSKSLLFSKEARQKWTEPDLLPLPFS